jgi:hypothetical protein
LGACANGGNTIEAIVDFFSSLLIGVFLGFVFGVGCALAVMYSIYMGGYRAAVRDAQLPSPPERLIAVRAKVLAAPARNQD